MTPIHYYRRHAVAGLVAVEYLDLASVLQVDTAVEPHRPADRHALTVSRTAYFPYFAKTKQIANPYASDEQLVP